MEVVEKNNDEEDREDEIPQLIVDCPQDYNLPNIIPTQPIQDTIQIPNMFLSNNDFVKLSWFCPSKGEQCKTIGSQIKETTQHYRDNHHPRDIQYHPI